jgi:transcriptional regulator with XRE-family HTH domain
VNLNREALIVIRERSGLSKTGLAERAGIDRTLVHRLENGERNATPAVLNKLASALDCPLMALIGPAETPEAA